MRKSDGLELLENKPFRTKETPKTTYEIKIMIKNVNFFSINYAYELQYPKRSNKNSEQNSQEMVSNNWG